MEWISEALFAGPSSSEITLFQSSFIMKSCLSIFLCKFAELGYLPGELIFQPYLWLAIERLCPLTGSDGESILGSSSSSFSYTYQMILGSGWWFCLLQRWKPCLRVGNKEGTVWAHILASSFRFSLEWNPCSNRIWSEQSLLIWPVLFTFVNLKPETKSDT